MPESTSKPHGYILAGDWAKLSQSTDDLRMRPINSGDQFEIQIAPDKNGLMGIKLSGYHEILYVKLSSVCFFPEWVVGDGRMGRPAVIGITEVHMFWEAGKPETLDIIEATMSPFKPIIDVGTGEVLIPEWKPNTLSIKGAKISPSKPLVDNEMGEVLAPEWKPDTLSIKGANISPFGPLVDIEAGEVLVLGQRMRTKALLGPCGIWCSVVGTVIVIQSIIIVSGIFMVYYFSDSYKLEE